VYSVQCTVYSVNATTVLDNSQLMWPFGYHFSKWISLVS